MRWTIEQRPANTIVRRHWVLLRGDTRVGEFSDEKSAAYAVKALNAGEWFVDPEKAVALLMALAKRAVREPRPMCREAESVLRHPALQAAKEKP